MTAEHKPTGAAHAAAGSAQPEHRLGLDEYFIEIARVVAKRGTCPRLRVGAVLVRDKMMISTGYNGAPKGFSHCIEVGCTIYKDHCVRAAHAEQNAVAQAAYNGIATKDSSLYVTHFPCQVCLKILVNAGVKRIVYDAPYVHKDATHSEANQITEDLIRESGLVVEQFRPPQ